MQKQIGPDGNKEGCGKTVYQFFLYEKEYKSASYINGKQIRNPSWSIATLLVSNNQLNNKLLLTCL